MRKTMKLLGITLCLSMSTYAQIGKGGTPKFSNENLAKSNRIPKVKLPQLDIAKLLKEDELESSKDVPMRFAYPHQTNLNPENSGKWFTNSAGDQYWLLEIESSGAHSLNLTFSDFRIPEGGELFIYNKSKSDIRGVFTSANNKESKTWATAPINGDIIVLEYYQPEQIRESLDLNISTVAHDYKGVVSLAKNFGDSGSCNNNVACNEGAPWRDQIRSVAMITLSSGTRLCTGALINNTANDGTPYFLTANHCIGGDVSNWIFVFNYESPNCNNSNVSASQSISGSELLGSGPNSDYALLRLTSTPPSSYNVYYSGWDATGSIPTNMTGIHHPVGDIKKISFDNDPGTSTEYFGGPGTSHWQVDDWDDGTTEPGSSGSPLFDQNKRIIGQLHGGAAACGNDKSDWYGSLSASFSGICNWLAPGCSTAVLNGYNPNGSGGTTDTEAPSIPTGLASSNVSETSLALSWTVSTDNIGVTEYDVYQGNSIVTSVIGSPANISGLTAGTTYQFRVKAKDAEGNTSAFSNTVSVTTPRATITYCDSHGNSVVNILDEFIGKVTLGSIDNSSGEGDRGYSDFTAIATNLSKGSVNTITITPTWTGSIFGEAYRVWIDYNKNGDFSDSGEMVFSQSVTQDPIVSGSFTVPTSAIDGSTRMRVSLKHNSLPNPCESFDYGEVEDYTVVIGGSAITSLDEEKGGKDSIFSTKENTSEITIYPNPATGNILNVSFSNIQSENISYAIIDISGKKVIEAYGKKESTIYIGNLKQGVYFLKMIDDQNNHYNAPFVKR